MLPPKCQVRHATLIYLLYANYYCTSQQCTNNTLGAAGAVQWCQPTAILSVNTSAIQQQQLGYLSLSTKRCCMQGTSLLRILNNHTNTPPITTPITTMLSRNFNSKVDNQNSNLINTGSATRSTANWVAMELRLCLQVCNKSDQLMVNHYSHHLIYSYISTTKLLFAQLTAC